MPSLTSADTIRILVATDNHVGYNERDPVRGDDSWKSFHEIMCLAKKRDVDMVMLAGDLFHENKPSRKSMYNVMRSLRMNCYGDKPCELEMLSDGSEHFDSTFGHANYEDPDINVAIPVFSIHGNHDDPSGEGHLAALDILEMSGLINYYGRTPESDNINVKPVLLQKGRTKLALYGLSNVRDERLFRSFNGNLVKFFQPGTQKNDWFNIMSVHQNHHAHTETSYLPENFLPDFLDLVIWGHEHECDIQPHLNPEMNFRVMQPGSSVATSLIAGEAIPKQVAILSVTGREFESEPIRLKTVRPFIYRDLILSQEKEAVKIAKKENHKSELTRFLMNVIENLIEQARADWQEARDEQDDDDDDDEAPTFPLPIIRLRVETTNRDGGNRFDCENPQRLSGRFIDKVANATDVVQFYARKKGAANRKTNNDETDELIMAQFQEVETIKVDQLVQEFLAAQSLTILPQNYFGDAVTQFVDKDDRHAMEIFVEDSLKNQRKHLVELHEQGEENDDDEVGGILGEQMEQYRTQLEELFAKGVMRAKRGNKAVYKPKPDNWDSDLDGDWEEQIGALLIADEPGDDDDDGEDGTPAPRPATRGGRGRGRARGSRAGAATSTRGKAAAKKPAATTARSKKKVVESDEEEEEDDDVIMLDDDDDDEDSQAMFFNDQKTSKAGSDSKGTRAHSVTAKGRQAATIRKPPARTAATRAKQSTINFTSSQRSVLGNGSARATSRSQSINDDHDDDEDDDDAFEPISKVRGRR